jgi:hypothetical protein
MLTRAYQHPPACVGVGVSVGVGVGVGVGVFNGEGY